VTQPTTNNDENDFFISERIKNMFGIVIARGCGLKKIVL
jgi:hypothetical protein